MSPDYVSVTTQILTITLIRHKYSTASMSFLTTWGIVRRLVSIVSCLLVLANQLARVPENLSLVRNYS